jgi:hypothetical protein
MTAVGPESDDLQAVERRIARELARLSAARPLGGQLVGPPPMCAGTSPSTPMLAAS